MFLTSNHIPKTLYFPEEEDLTQEDQAPARLSNTQENALDLYARGFNVLPVKPHSKEPYLLELFFTARLHHCDSNCHHKGSFNIAEIFRRQNIGLMTGRTSGNLVAIDCDSQEALTRIGQELTARELPYWATASSRGGAYLLRVIEGEAHNKPKDMKAPAYCQAQAITKDTKFSDVEIWGNRHFLVVPPSIHPSGIVYRWITTEPRARLSWETLQAVSIKALEWLGVSRARNRATEPELYGLPEWSANLSLRNRQTYADDLGEGERNNRLFNLACDMKGNDVDYHEAESLILDTARRVGTPRREALATLKSAYKRERTPARKNGSLKVKEWQQAKAFADAYDWRATFGRKTLKRRAVYQACIERARLDGRLHWRATAREIAELANMSKTTAIDSLHDLAAADLIKRVSYKDAGIYRFVGLSQLGTVVSTGSCSVPSWNNPKPSPQTQAEQDVFGRFGLVSWHVWSYLMIHEARNAGEIARATGLPRSSVWRALKLLAHPMLGLVEQDMAEGGVYHSEPMTDGGLAELAATIFNGGSPSKARKDQHKLQRELRVNNAVRRQMAKEQDRADQPADRAVR